MKKQLLITIFIKLSLFAGVVTDGSLGNSVNLTGPDYTIGQELGQLSGSNLFHSFDQFNLATGESALFTGNSQITNIIGRITGGASFIDGEVGSSINGANLFLINQAGMIFGQNASLNLTGAFHASTADYLQFSNQERFYSNPLMGSILSASSPESFGFLGNNGSITIDGTNLAVTADNNLSFSANGVKVTNSAQLTAEDGSINLSSIEHGTTTTESLSSNFLGADLAVDENSLIRTDGHGSGKIFIQGGEILINASTIENLNSGNSDDSLISLKSDKLNLTNSSYIKSVTTSEGNAADVIVTAKEINIIDKSTISSNTNLLGTGYGGNSGEILLNADKIIANNSSVKTYSLKGNGIAGRIQINTDNLFLLNGSFISSSKLGMGVGKNY